jgi:SulP family sulfate permease
MLATVVVTVWTHNLAYGVVVGVLVAAVLFAQRVAHLTTVTRLDASDDDGERVYAVSGELFFASSNDLVYQFDYAGDPRRVVIDMTDAHVWDASTVAALDAVQHKYATRGKEVVFRGLNEDSERRLARLGGNLGAGH